MARLTLIYRNHFELNYYSFKISLDKCNGSCKAVDDLSLKICAPSKTKDVNIKSFNIITSIHEAKTLVKHISCDFKWKFNSMSYNSNQKLNNDTWQCKYKKYSVPNRL